MRYAIPLVILSLCLNIAGTRWAGPDDERISLVFGDTETVEAFSAEMLKSREELYQDIQYYDQAQKYEERQISVNLKDGRTIRANRTVIDAARSYLLRSYAPDEQATLKAISNMEPARLNFNPRFFFYGGLYLYPLAAFLWLLSLSGVITVRPDISYYFLHPEQMGMLFIAGKVFGAIFTSFAAYFVYKTGSRLYNSRTGLIAALIFSVTPAVTVWSHYLNPYAYTLFWMMLSLFLCTKLFDSDETRHYVFSGLSAGLTTGALSMYGLVVFSIPVIHFLKNLKNGFRAAVFSLFDRKIWLALLFFAAGFLAVNPCILTYLKQLSSEISSAAGYYPFRLSLVSVRHYLRYTVLAAFGLPAWLMVACGSLYALLKHRKEDVLLLLLLSAAVLYFSCAMTNYMHYGLFIVPLLILLGARLVDSLLARKNLLKIAGILSLSAVLVYTFSYSLSIDIAASRKNTRSAAGEWINESIPAGAVIGMMELPSPWRTPPFRYFDYRISVTGLNEGELKKTDPEYFIVEEHQWLRVYTYGRVRAFLKDYEELKKFENYPSVLGMQFRRDGNSPWDWPDINPEIIVFKRRANK